MKIKQQIDTTIVIKFTDEDLVKILEQAIIDRMLEGTKIDPGIGIIDILNRQNMEFHVEVPGGGDWSNTNLTISEDTPVIVTIKVQDNIIGIKTPVKKRKR